MKLCRPGAIAILMMTTAALGQARPGVSFELGRDASATARGAVVAGDFNRDGKPDLITCCSGNALELRLGNGDGTFQPGVSAVTAPAPVVALAAADVNHDGNPDLVGVAESGGLVVWLGNGNGTFRAPQTYATTGAAISVTVGDFFGDGFPDIATGDRDGSVDFFRNEGGSGFVRAKTIRLAGIGGSSAIESLGAGRIGGGSASDVAAVAGGGVAWVLWNHGYGDFRPEKLGSYVDPAVSVSDMNGDGLADVIVAYTCRPTPVSEPGPGPQYEPCAGFDVYYGQSGNRTEQRTVVSDPGVYSPGAYSPDIVPGQTLWGVDVNGDGYTDLVAMSGLRGLHSFGLFVWMGHADGSFDPTPEAFISNSSDAGQGAAADFNRDGRMDFAMSSPRDGYAEFFLNATEQAACGSYTSGALVTVCQPVNGTYSTSPVRVEANAFDAKNVTALQEYVDGKLQASEADSRLDKSFPEKPGEHWLATKAWDAGGGSVETDRSVTVFEGSPGAVCAEGICLPDGTAAGTATGASVHIVANGRTATIPTAAQLYINGKLVVHQRGPCAGGGSCLGGTSYVDTEQRLPQGQSTIVFKLWDVAGKVYTAQRVVTVR